MRTFPSCSERPAGNALRRLTVFDLEGLPSRRVAGTVSKYGSWRWVSPCASILHKHPYFFSKVVLQSLSKNLLANDFGNEGSHVEIGLKGIRKGM